MNTNIKQRNKSLYKFSNTQKPKIIGNSILSNFYPKNEIDNFQSTVSNITKQLNNMALGMISKSNNKINNSYFNSKDFENLKGKSNFILDILNTDKKEELNNTEHETKYKENFDFSYNKFRKENYIISKINSICLKEENNSNNVFNETELKQENKNLKENIKFLLGQVKKYQKGGLSIEENNKNCNNNEIEINNELRNIIIEKEKEIESLKNNYQNEIKTILEKISFLEIQYKNLKNKYNELKNNKIKDFGYINKDIYNDEIIKTNNSEILENNNNKKIFELNQNHPIFKNRKKLINETNINFENSKNEEDYFYPKNNIEKRFTFNRREHSNDYNNELFFRNLKKDTFHKYNKSIQINNLTKYKNLKLNNDKCISLNNTLENSKEKNNYKLIKKEIGSKTTKGNNNISFLYKKTPLKTEIIKNNLSTNNKSKIAKSASHNYLNLNQKINHQNFKKSYNNNHSKENTIYPKLIRKLSSTLYRKKNNKVLIQNNKSINNNSYNNFNYDKYYTKEDETKINNFIVPTPSISFSSVRFSKNEEENKQERDIPLPKIDLSPVDLYYFPINDISLQTKSEKDSNNIVYNFNIDNMKFSTIEYSLENNSTFNLSYSSSSNYSYDILLSITNGFLIVTGKKTNYLYYYNKTTNYIYDLCKLNFSHNKGTLLKINNDQIMCISGINSVDVEMYYLKDNICLNLPKMNCSHSESSYMIYNNNIIFSFFGYDYDNKKYINDIEFLILKNYYSESTWNNICINTNNNIFNLRNHSIFYRMNKENNDSKDIFIVGGYSNTGRNNGLIQIFIEEIQNDKYNFEFMINFKKYEENKVKIKGINNVNLNKYKSMDNLFLFSNEFNQFFDEENNLFYSYNCDNNFNIHIIDNFTLKHTIYRNKIKNNY